MNEKIVKTILKLICKDYEVAKKSSSIALENYRFDAFIFTKPVIAKFMKKNNLEDDLDVILTLLEDNGYLKSHYEQFQLTKLGYEHGTVSVLGKSLCWLNQNPGFISFVSLAVAVCALFVSLNK